MISKIAMALYQSAEKIEALRLRGKHWERQARKNWGKYMRSLYESNREK
jgi:hypothetical protein